MKTRIFTALALLLWASLLSAQTAAPTKEQKVRQLLELVGAGQIGVQILDGMITNFESAMPSVPHEFWGTFRKSVNAKELVDLIVPIYDKHLTEADVDELIRFYQSPVGKRFVEKQPLILQDSMAAGQVWGEKLAERALQLLREKRLLPQT